MLLSIPQIPFICTVQLVRSQWGSTRQGCPMSAADFTSRYVTTIRGLIPLCYIARRFILKCQYHGKKRREHLAQGPLDQ